VGLGRYDMSDSTPYFALGSLLFMVAGNAIALSVEMVRGNQPYHPGVLGLWGLTFALIAILAGVYFRRRSRRKRETLALSDLGRQFAVERLRQPAGLAHWLNRFWPAPYDPMFLTGGTGFVGASFVAFGYPALLNAQLGSKERRPRLHVLLAAQHRTGFVAYGEAAAYVQRVLAYCRSLGFEVTPSEAGLLAVANEETGRLVRRNLEALHQVAAVLGALANAARASGSVPAGPAS
ncbi:MAG TPA: hypothetical protein VGK73_07410, partial [Polyangiaceae bacterium]